MDPVKKITTDLEFTAVAESFRQDFVREMELTRKDFGTAIKLFSEDIIGGMKLFRKDVVAQIKVANCFLGIIAISLGVGVVYKIAKNRYPRSPIPPPNSIYGRSNNSIYRRSNLVRVDPASLSASGHSPST